MSKGTNVRRFPATDQYCFMHQEPFIHFRLDTTYFIPRQYIPVIHKLNKNKTEKKPIYSLAIFKISLHLNLIFHSFVCEFWVHLDHYMFWLPLNIKPYKCTHFLTKQEPFLLIYSVLFFTALSWNFSWLLSSHSHHNQFICSRVRSNWMCVLLSWSQRIYIPTDDHDMWKVIDKHVQWVYWFSLGQVNKVN